MTSGRLAAPSRRSVWRTASAQNCPSARTKTAVVVALDGGSRWEHVEGDDIINEQVLETHRFCQSFSVLGHGTPEGYVDHEFPAGSASIDGIIAPQVKKGQEALIELLAEARPTGPEGLVDDDGEEPPREAPRCFCGKRARQNRVRLPGAAVFRRPFYRCAGQSCRFISMAESGPSARTQAISWARFQTGMAVNDQLVVVGIDGYRPEDVRFGPEVESSGDSFIDALAVLAERPEVISQLLPNVKANGEGHTGCHEVRLCVDGHWQAFLVDERLPIRATQIGGSSSSTRTVRGQRPDQELAFGRAAGNQMWPSLLEKAYAKAFGAYDFAFPGMLLSEALTDLTGAPVESRKLPLGSPGADDEAESLWQWLRQHHEAGVLIACTTRWELRGNGNHGPSEIGRLSVHALLDLAEPGNHSLLSAGLGRQRAVRLRNPRTGFHASLNYQNTLASLGGVPAEASTHGDGSFWVQFPLDFLNGFSRVDACHAAKAGGNLFHCKSFRGEATPEGGLGVRGCTFRLRTAHEHRTSCWLTVVQQTPKGARLLRPAMGRVLNDLGLLVLDCEGRLRALSFGGAWRDTTCYIELEPGREYMALPFSFRAWSGSITLRVHANYPIQVKSTSSPELVQAAWGGILDFATSSELPMPSFASLRSNRRTEHVLFLPRNVRNEKPPDHAVMFVVQFDGATIAVVRNPHDRAILVEFELDASYLAVHTSRGAQFGIWLQERNMSAAQNLQTWHPSQPAWRRFVVEDAIPAQSQQLVCMMFSLARQEWDMDIRRVSASELPSNDAGTRPSVHPFAPRRLQHVCPAGIVAGERRNHGSEFVDASADEEALQLALEISLADTHKEHTLTASLASLPAGLPHEGSDPGIIANKVPHGHRRGRWSRRERSRLCMVCGEAVSAFEPVPCCGEDVCATCLSRWAHVQVLERGASLKEVRCPFCEALLDEGLLPSLLDAALFQVASDRAVEREMFAHRAPLSTADIGLDASVLKLLRAKQCPGCGMGVQKESETCHKMICRNCKTKFCFKCLHRLEYFNCGCTGAEHNFVDPVSGELVSHQ